MTKPTFCITGDDTGFVKRVGLAKSDEQQRWGTQAAGGGVGCLSWGPGDDESVCGAGLQTGTVRFWDASAAGGSTMEYAAPPDEAAAIVGLRAVGSRVVACDAEGRARVWQWAAPTPGGVSAEAPLLSFQVGKRAAFGVVGDDGRRLATGGRDVDLSVWDVERGEASWRARNVPHDNLDLPVPVWCAGARFVPQSESQIVSASGFQQNRLRGEVRLYDMSANRRPQLRTHAPLGEEALSAIAMTPDGRYVIAGSVSGGLCRLDMRKNLQTHTHKRYHGAAGCVKSLVVHPTLPLVACAGLDRLLRVYSVGSGELHSKVYLKHRLTSVLFSASFEAAPAKADGDEDGEDVEHMLAQIKQVDDAAGAKGGEAGGEEGDDDDDDSEEAEEKDERWNVSVTVDGAEADDDDADGDADDADEDGDGDDDDDDDDDDDEEEEEVQEAPRGKRKGPPKAAAKQNEPSKAQRKRGSSQPAAGSAASAGKKKKKRA